MGISVNGPNYIQGENQLVLTITIILDLNLKKKVQTIAYNFMLERVARDKWRTSYISMHEKRGGLNHKVTPVRRESQWTGEESPSPHILWC